MDERTPLERAIVPELDRILGHPWPVLDDGFVRVVDYLGSDQSIVQAARVSYGAGTKAVHEDAGLIRYLMRHRHTTPFEMCEIKLHVRVPMDTWRQWIRHRTACLAAGTRVTFDLPRGVRRGGPQPRAIRIEELFEKLEPTIHRRGPDKHGSPRSKADRVRSVHLRQMNEETGVVQHTRVADVYRNGVKPVFRMLLADGKWIECTADHRFKFADGWKTLVEATGLHLIGGRAVWNDGDYSVYVNGREVTAKPVHRHVVPAWPDSSAAPHEVNPTMFCVSCARNVNRSALTSVERLGEPRVRTAWRTRPRTAWSKPTVAQLVRVERFEYVGEKETYDVEVEGPYHNFIANGIVTHNSVNEYSTRYSIAIDQAAATAPGEWRRQSSRNRQGSAGVLPEETGRHLATRESELQHLARTVYEERLAAGVAREQARKDLPLSTYTEAYWKIDLHNLLHFLSLRMDEHAQEEIRAYATVIGNEIVSRWCPIAWQAFKDYGLNSLTLSALEIEVVRRLAAGDREGALGLAERFGWLATTDGKLRRNRERAEASAKLRSLGFDPPWSEQPG